MSGDKAYRVIPESMKNAICIVAAESRAKAKHAVISSAREVGFEMEYTDKFSVCRVPEYDEWAQHTPKNTVASEEWIKERIA